MALVRKTKLAARTKKKTSAGTDDVFEGPAIDAKLRLSFYLAMIKLPVDQKKAWKDLIPAMSDRQIKRLANILENHLVDEATQDVDEVFKRELSGIMQQSAASAERLPTTQRVQLLERLKLAFQKRVRQHRARQHKMIAEALHKADRQKGDEVLKSINT